MRGRCPGAPGLGLDEAPAVGASTEAARVPGARATEFLEVQRQGVIRWERETIVGAPESAIGFTKGRRDG